MHPVFVSEMARVRSTFWKSHPVLYDVVEIYFCVHAYLKNAHEGYGACPKVNAILRFSTLLLALLVTIVGCIALSPLITYRASLDAVLKYTLGKKYGGLLDVDTLFTSQKRCIAVSVLTIDFDGNAEEFGAEVERNVVPNVCRAGFKLSSTVESFMGFQYYSKGGEISTEDAVYFIEAHEYSTKNDLIEYIERSLLHTSISNRAQWEIRIGTRPILRTKQYPVVLRTNHSHGDGMALLRILQNCFSEDAVLSNDYREKRDKRIPTNNSRRSYFIDDLLELENARLPFNVFKRTQALPRFGATKKTQLAMFCEEDVHYVPLVKRVKKRLGEVTFTEVLIAALVGSLCDYFTAVGECPKNLTTCVTTTTRFTDAFFEKKDPDHRRTNNASAWQVFVPLKTELKKVADHVRVVHDVCTPARTSICNEFAFWTIQLTAMMPFTFTEYICKNYGVRPNLLVSNIPGLKPQTLRGQHKVQDMIIFLEEYQDIEFIFVVGTYSERFQLTLVVKEGVLKNEGDARHILKEAVKCLDRLEEETGA